MVTLDFRPEVEIRQFHACAMHTAITIETVHSLWTWLWGRYHVPQNVFLVFKTSRRLLGADLHQGFVYGLRWGMKAPDPLICPPLEKNPSGVHGVTRNSRTLN